MEITPPHLKNNGDKPPPIEFIETFCEFALILESILPDLLTLQFPS